VADANTSCLLAGFLSLARYCLAWAEGHRVARAQFSTDVIDREPIDDIGPSC